MSSTDGIARGRGEEGADDGARAEDGDDDGRVGRADLEGAGLVPAVCAELILELAHGENTVDGPGKKVLR